MRQGLKYFPIGHTCMLCTPSQGIRDNLVSLQRTWNCTKFTYGVHVIIPWEPDLDEPMINLNQVLDKFLYEVMKNHLCIEVIFVGTGPQRSLFSFPSKFYYVNFIQPCEI